MEVKKSLFPIISVQGTVNRVISPHHINARNNKMCQICDHSSENKKQNCL